MTVVGPDGQPLQVPIEGGDTAREIAADAEKAAKRAKEVTEGNRIVVDAIDEALKRSNAPGSFGTGRIINETLGGILPGGGEGALAGSDAASLDAIVKTITSNIGFEELNKMRANSPTGGALGPVSDKENELLQSTKAALQTSQTREQFQEQLAKLRRQIVAVTTGENYEEVMGFPPGGPAAPGAADVAAGSAATGIPAYVPGKIYTDANGNRAKWNGTSWEEL